MGSLARMAAVIASAGLIFAAPASASPSAASAEKLRRLDIMLMVTSLRCRLGSDDFRHEYGSFSARHLPVLNAASNAMKADLESRHGPAGAHRALDRVSTSMANQYGQGHPWLGCGQLRMVARHLAEVEGAATLEEAADQLLASRASGAVLAYAGR